GQLGVELAEAHVVRRLRRHLLVEARLAVAEAVQGALEPPELLAGLAQDRARRAGRPVAPGVGGRAGCGRGRGPVGCRMRLAQVLLDPAGEVADPAGAVERV